jgi:internalin A
MAWPALAQGGEGIVFSDAVLEQKVREAMGKPEGPITAEDAAALTWLDAEALQDAPEDAKIKSLEGLEDFYNLEGLHLSFNAIHDITILAKLPHLRGLWLDGNPIDDLSPLGELTGLDNLSFDGGFRELPFLKNLTELVELNIGACRELPQELLGMKKLTVFKAPGGELADISLLAQLSGLSAVDVSWNLVEDLEPLRNLPLTELYIAGDPIEDYTPIREIIPNLVGMDFDTAVVLAADIPQDPLTFPDANLEQALRAVMGIQDRPITLRDAYLVHSLDLNHPENSAGPITDISPLKDFVTLSSLNLEGQQVSDLTPLKGLTKLEWLNLRNNRIVDLTPIKDLTSLRSLFLEGNPISGLSPLKDLTSLRILYLDRQGNDQSPLEGLMPALEDTNLILVPENIPADPLPISDPTLETILRKATGVQDRPITYRDAYRITELQLGFESMWQSVSDISALSSFVNLERLMIFGSQVSDLSPLASLPKLQVLGVHDSRVSDLTPLLGMKGLGQLELRGNQITDLTPLQGLAGLECLDVSHNQITDLSPLYGLQKLSVLYISHNLTTDASGFKDIAMNLKDKDFDPDKPMEAAGEEGEAGQEGKPGEAGKPESPSRLRVPENPDKVIKFTDKVLEQRIREAMGKPEGPITAGDAAQVTELYIGNEWQEKFSKGSQIVKLDGIEYFINLKSLDLSFHKLKDFKKLSGLTELTYLKVFGNAIQDLKPLSGLTNLTSLNVGGNNIKSLKPISGLVNLTGLYLSDNPIKDFSPIADIYPKLTEKDFEMK